MGLKLNYYTTGATRILGLKSAHFGIEINAKKQIIDIDWLKSDHFGIEMQLNLLQYPCLQGLKSDHFGIEIPVQSLSNLL